MRFTDEKVRQQQLLLEENKTITAVSTQLNISADYIRGMLQEIEEDIREHERIKDLGFVSKYSNKVNELLSGATKEKVDKASLRDIAVSIGILQDKRRDLLGPSKGAGNISLKFAFRDGAGALELTTNTEK